MTRLAGKHILVTAAAQGIGRATVEAAAAEGALVIATDVNEQLLVDLEAIENVTARRLDVLDGAAIARLPTDVGALDGLVNVAGYVHHGSILDADDAAMDVSWRLNVQSMHRMIRAVLPAMLERGGGSIVNIASVASSLKGVPNRFVYGTTKAAVIGLTKSVAADFVARGVRCNAVCPGTIATPSLEQRIQAFDDPQAARQGFLARQPMGRLGTAAEVAAAVVYLLADESAYVTGSTHLVDGGWAL
ncbi:MAG: SDR family oxidoreductase [Alphaproteobacteria bacterium]